MESGIQRANYTRPVKESNEFAGSFSNHAIRAVATDGLNQVKYLVVNDSNQCKIIFNFLKVVLAAFADCQLVTWNFKSMEFMRETTLSAAPTFIQIHRHRQVSNLFFFTS